MPGRPGRWRELIEAGAIQSVGSAAGLLITVVLAHTGGPELQGRFGLAKAELDFLTSLCLIGLPQAAFYFSQRRELPSSAAKRLIVIQACIAGCAVLLWKAFWASNGSDRFSPDVVALCYAIALIATVSYSMVRGASLAYRTPREFALYSAAPPVLLLANVMLTLAIVSNWRAYEGGIALMFAVSYGLCAVIGYRFLLPGSSPGSELLTVSLFRRLVRYGGATWLASVSQAACVYTALRWIERRAGGVEAAGIFSAGIALVLIAVTPINLIVPILFKQWTGASARIQRREFVEIASIVVGGAIVVALLMSLYGSEIIGFLLGSQYIPFASTFLLLCFAIVPQCLLRLWGVRYSAVGKPGLAVWLETFRLLALGLGLIVAGSNLNNVAWVWLSAEFTTLGLGLILGSRIKLTQVSD